MIAPHEILASAAAAIKSDTEADLRICINRAYYSAFHVAMPFGEVHLRDPNANRRIGVHERLRLRFEHAQCPDSKDVAAVLERLCELRVIADYKLNATVSKRMAKRALAAARDLPEKLARCTPRSSQKEHRTEPVTSNG